MKFFLLCLCLFVGYSSASRDFSTGDRGRSGSGSSGTGSRSGSGDRWGTGTGTGSLSGRGGGQCQWVRGHVKCADNSGKHDKNHVVVRLVDGSTTSGSGNVLDEAYSSQNGQFAVFGCGGSGSFRGFKPELNILHFCKSNRARRLKVPVPDNQVGGEYNITAVLDLKAYYPEEQDYSDHIQLPCAV